MQALGDRLAQTGKLKTDQSKHYTKINTMRTVLKIILIFVALMVGGLLIALIKEGSGRGSNSPGVGGPIGIIVTLAMMAGIRAIWKYSPEKKDDNSISDNDKHQLDKK